jgi:D-3-phosphoglycerate dehydrogenase
LVSEDERAERLRVADIVIGDKLHRHRLDRAVLERMSRCRLIQQAAVGFDTIDHTAAAEMLIPVANATGFNTEAVADWAVMAILSLVRHAPSLDRSMRAGEWTSAAALLATPEALPREVGGLTVGIVGLGNAGRPVARRLAGFGCRILFTDVVEVSMEGAQQVDLEVLVTTADVITLHVPLTTETHHLFDASLLDRVRPGAILVNASRGKVVDEAALLAALASGRLAAAALDVFEEEPPVNNSPLRALDNVLLSPHVAGLSVQAEVRLKEIVGANVGRALRGEDPVNVVNGVRSLRLHSG